jgi:hypothetical protein
MGELSRTARQLALRCALACMLFAGAGLAQSQSTPQSPLQSAPPAGLERQVKAAYLLKFASFVEWPETSFARPDSVLQIGVAGSAALAEQLEHMVAGRSVNGHPLKVRRLAAGDTLAELHILFLDNSLDRAALGALMAAARGQSLLTVSDGAEAAALGCMINFVVADDKLRFDVALRAVAPSRLRISARMLAVAHRVQGAT